LILAVFALFDCNMKYTRTEKLKILKGLNWGKILNDAREKEMGLDPAVLADLILSISREGFDALQWVRPVSWDQFRSDLNILVYEMLRGEDNSLCAIDGS